MPFIPAGSPPPAAASAIFTVTQQAGIMAGTGITAINSLTGASQALATGASGTDFAIVSSGTTHTFNLPIASATNTGKLSNADWSIFNGKQDLLVSGTNIKTINGSSILGSGDLPVTASNGVSTIRVSGANVTTTSTAASTITGLTITPTANKSYEFWGVLIFSNTTTAGTKFALSSTTNSIQLGIIAAAAGVSPTFGTTYVTSQALTGQSFGNANTYPAYVFGRVVVGANTNAINFQFGVATGGTSTIFIGSWIKYQEI
jgi:hypothetical protein